MAFTDEELKFTLQKAQEIQKWTDLVQQIKDLPSGYDTLTYRLSIMGKLNLNIILDRLRLDRKDGLAQQVETARDNLFNEVKAYDKNYHENHPKHLPDFGLKVCTADRLVILLRKIFNDEIDDYEKLSMYADNIEDLVSDNLTLYPAIWEKQFKILLNIAVGYDLFDALLDRIEKDKTAGTQLKAKYQQLKQISDVDNAKEKELKAVETAALDSVSLMRKIAETERDTTLAKCWRIVKKITGWLFKKTSCLIGAIIGSLIVAILIDVFGDFGWLEQIKAFIDKILVDK